MKLHWIHEDLISLHALPKGVSSGDLHSFFIWDKEYFQSQFYGLKRLNFIFESLQDLEVDIYEGKTADVLDELIKMYTPEVVYVGATPNPYLQEYITEISDKPNSQVQVIEIAHPPLVNLKSEPDLKRFFRYWNKAKKSALNLNAGIKTD